MFKCTVIDNKQEVVITVDSLWKIPDNSISVEHNTGIDVGMFLHIKSRAKDITDQLSELTEIRETLTNRLSDMDNDLHEKQEELKNMVGALGGNYNG